MLSRFLWSPTNICDVIIFSSNMQPMRHIEQIAAPFTQHFASLTVECYHGVVFNWPEVSFCVNVHIVEGTWAPFTLSSVENDDIVVHVKSNCWNCAKLLCRRGPVRYFGVICRGKFVINFWWLLIFLFSVDIVHDGPIKTLFQFSQRLFNLLAW